MAKRKPKVPPMLESVVAPPEPIDDRAERGSVQGDGFELRRVIVELSKRRIEGLRLYEPMPAMVPFHKSKVKELLVIGSNRSGKTTCCAAAVGLAVTGQDLERFPAENGIFYVVGMDQRSLSDILGKKLLRAGTFKMIRDEFTGAWRAFQPNLESDTRRSHEAKPAPPLIPPRMIENITWLSKKAQIPKLVRLRNGWEIHFFSSEAIPPRGVDINGAWFDEEIKNEEWYSEIAARLVDRSGTFFWSATPQAGTDQLYDLHERAAEQELWVPEKRSIEEYRVLLADNIHLTEKQKRDFEAKLNHEQRSVRIAGEFAFVKHKVFGEWSDRDHVIPSRAIPDHWTRYVAIDPGRQVCAVLFGAVPSPDDTQYSDDLYLYDELYIKGSDAMTLGAEMKKKAAGQSFRVFIIDKKGSDPFEMGSGKQIRQQYADAFKVNGVRSDLTGHGFVFGDTNPKAGIEGCRPYLKMRPDGTMPLKVMKDKCPNFIEEIKYYRYKRVKVNGEMVVTDVPEDRGRVHSMATFRYMVQYGPHWHPAKSRSDTNVPIRVWRQQIKKMMNRGAKKSGMHLGPGVGA